METLEERRFNEHLQELDRLSDLPEVLRLHILSFLPTKFAVRASLLSLRFRNLWTFSPSIDLDRSDFPPGRLFVDVTNRIFRRRDPSAPLLRLSLSTTYEYRLPIKSLSKWLSAAQSMGLRHLSLRIHLETFEPLLPLILSFGSLESFSIDNLGIQWRSSLPVRSEILPKFDLIHLKSLHLAAQLSCSELTRLVNEQRNLEYFCHEAGPRNINLSSPTLKIFKQSWQECFCGISNMSLSFPNLVFLDLSVELRVTKLQHFNGDLPLLRKAMIKIHGLEEDCRPLFGDLLRCITNVEELNLHIEKFHPTDVLMFPCVSRKKNQNKDEYPFHPLVQPGNEKDLPTFPNLKRLKLSMCFHELSIHNIVCLLHNSSVLESLHLVHVVHIEYPESNKSDRWISKLPPNSEGNNEHAYFDDLHLGDKKMQVINKLLCNEAQMSKKPRIL